jgi:hypothetical protein
LLPATTLLLLLFLSKSLFWWCRGRGFPWQSLVKNKNKV